MSCCAVQALTSSYGIATELIELQNLITVGTHIVEAALLRKESRGGHFSLDYPPKPKVKVEREAPQKSGSNWKKYGRSSRKEADLGSLVRGGSPPRRRSRDVVFRSQAENEQ